MWVKCMYNWVVNGILASLNNKELLIFGNGNDSLYIESTNWLLCLKKKRKKKTIFWKWKILDSHRNEETIQVLYVTHGEEFDLEGWKVAPIQQRLSKERTSLIFLFLLHYYRVYIPFCQLVIICHNLSQLLLICLQSIFEVIKHSIAQK